LNIDQTSTTPTKSGQATAKLDADFQNFLQLLTAQLQHQDPMAPMDSTTFVTQLAQLSQVEQAVQTNGNLEGIRGQLSATGSLADVALIGKSVKTATQTLKHTGEGASFQYALSGPSETTEVHIKDADGNIVKTFDQGQNSGDMLKDITWDGNDDAGNPVADGTFTVSIEAKDAEGETVKYDSYATNEVKEVLFQGGETILNLTNGELIGSGQIVSVS